MQISDRQKYTMNTVAGLTGGAGTLLFLPSAMLKLYGKCYYKYATKFTKAECDEYWSAAKKACQQEPLLNNKVTVTDINESNWDRVASDLARRQKELRSKSKGLFRKKFNEEEYKEKLRVYARGKNACYYPCFSQVLVNKEKRANTVFHELGHAINAKGSGFKNFLSKTRGKTAALAPFVAGISLLIPKDREENPTDNFAYKSLLWFKKYSAIILSACMLPTVMEEGMASINAKKLGKNVLSSELYKKMNKMNVLAFSSYVALMLFAGVGLAFANYVKDKVTGPLPEKKDKAESVPQEETEKTETAEKNNEQTDVSEGETQSA